ncbi:hypothetical protein ACFY12_34540 [Streptomyces sp. NPDC001339]|uniref:hypothetical protein n=1 Tax=Streptomyces sp. NPDC001339 TaxID=3364563 RepID=UPI0036860AFC
MSTRLLLRCPPGTAFSGPADVPPDHVCFADWGAGECVRWARGYPSRAGDRTAVERRAAEEWAQTAQAAADEARTLAGAGSIMVWGDGTLAMLIRMALRGSTAPHTRSPAVVVDTTGSADALAQALRLVIREGSVLLAAPPLQPDAVVRTYEDLHRRSLTVKVVPWAEPPSRAPWHLVDWALDHLARATPESPPIPAPWHRVGAGGIAIPVSASDAPHTTRPQGA